MICTPLEALTYHVASRTGKEPYLVDIGSLRWHQVCNGRCTCPNFQNLYPMVREFRQRELGGWTGLCTLRGGNLIITLGQSDPDVPIPFVFTPNNQTRCVHIMSARAYAFDELLDRTVTALAEKFKQYKGDEEWQ